MIVPLGKMRNIKGKDSDFNSDINVVNNDQCAILTLGSEPNGKYPFNAFFSLTYFISVVSLTLIKESVCRTLIKATVKVDTTQPRTNKNLLVSPYTILPSSP